MAELMEAWKLKNKNEDWKSDALCREYKEIRWFPHRGYNHTNSAQAKEICGRCMVREECLQYSLDNMFPAGIWGGKTADERLQILGLKGWGVTTK
jgi:WhiB family redox-sensing transcriptional regulator